MLSVGVPPTAFNLEVLHAQRRGCSACHKGNLASVVQNLPKAGYHPSFAGIAHPTIVTSYGIPFTIEDCLMCHATDAKLPFAPYIHGIHLDSGSFVNMGGNCDSCHAVIQQGDQLVRVLWDRQTKYSLINGVVVSQTPGPIEP
jgi:formate-dependent nitrite reductase cytochrome c552 subunit